MCENQGRPSRKQQGKQDEFGRKESLPLVDLHVVCKLRVKYSLECLLRKSMDGPFEAQSKNTKLMYE